MIKTVRISLTALVTSYLRPARLGFKYPETGLFPSESFREAIF